MKKKYGILLLLIGGIVISLSLAVNDALAEGEEIIKSRGDS
jgi:hypothetical protein